jgi:dolichyl-phosphate beta-glucosyltransferase
MKFALSIVIPAFNEEKRLGATIKSSLDWCRACDSPCEIVVVDDGSTDFTLEVARSFEAAGNNVRVISCPHRGKGGTVKAGMLAAKGEYVLFMDADGATPLSEINKLIEQLQAGYDVAIGSRARHGADDPQVAMSVVRRLVGETFISVVHLLAFGGIEDSQCGFKMFRRQVVPSIFSRQQVMGFAFDVEILFIASRLGLSIAEVPVQWHAQPGSKVRIFRDALKMLWDISSVRWLHRDLRQRARVAYPAKVAV